MKYVIIIIRLLFIFSISKSEALNFDDEFELSSIYKTDVESIKKLSIKSSLSAITYSTLKGEESLLSLSDCKSENYVWEFSCVLSLESNYSNRLKYNDGYKILKAYRERVENKKIDNKLFEMLVDRERLLYLSGKQEYKFEKIIHVKNFSLDLQVGKENFKFTTDTGAQFSTLKNEKESKEDVYSLSFSGTVEKREVFNLDTRYIKKMLFLKDDKYNLLGLNFLKNFDLVVFNQSEDIYSFELLEDSTNLFSIGYISIDGVKFNNLNLCVDTGSASSVIVTKGYQKIRSNIRGRKVKKIKVKDIGGSNYILGKKIDKITVGLGESNLILYNVAALSKINASTGCDAILGRDFLSKKLISIDFKNRKLNIKV